MINRAFFIHFLFYLALCCLVGIGNVSAQEEEKPSIPLDHFYAKPKEVFGLRKLISKLNFSFETGYGRTFYSQDLSNFNLLQRVDSVPVIFNPDLNTSGGNLSVGYDYWFNRANSNENISFDSANDFLIGGDSTNLKFKAPGTSIPVTGMIHVEIDRYKIGGGFSFEYHRPSTFEPTAFKDRIASFDPDFNATFHKKYFILLGAKVYRYYEWLLSVDTRIGAYRLGRRFDRSIIQKGIFVNLGGTIERELSEYFSAFVRPSFDFKNYTLSLPESNLDVNHSMNAFYIGVGVKYRLPEHPKCFIKNCTTQINHQHGNSRIYRSRKHPFYKKQNPHHGENYPRLIKYKRKNRRKLEPY
ncbi:hypothetical protein FNH22_24145 [Fulvivirga sp. M361]|uniref:hypothetical protein n=1 Tax=Fulvivirga sp. M361 TaxID=2594266 RepID=UPI00117B8DE2|nr:hypothetical protein [Fulvivirga sp. M361]TRX51385.1 hypothetical protein FNH22_24145 [Fulvivirga sp. M361]